MFWVIVDLNLRDLTKGKDKTKQMPPDLSQLTQHLCFLWSPIKNKRKQK